MSFKTNEAQQISLNDAFLNLTERERKALENSWAQTFSEELFPAIDEKPFNVLYSDKASRPNTPVNVIIGALIIKELFDLSDDEMVENLMLDLHYQYALHTTSFEEQPLSDKTLARFRRRCYDYETLTGKDLYHDCIESLGGHIAKLMGINQRIKRMDSMMIEANMKKLSRLELLYVCVARAAMLVNAEQKDLLPENLRHYCEKDDYNRVIYHTRNEDSEEKIVAVLSDADALLELCSGKYEDSTEYRLLVRCLSEQTVVEEGIRRLRTKEDGTMTSDMMQNPSDPEATFRRKAGKEHRGYAANLEESVGEKGSVVTGYQYDDNTRSDSSFLKESIENTEKADETAVLVTDGAYSGEDNRKLAAEKNIELVTTDLLGKEAPDIYADFEYDEEGKKVTRCPAGYEPKNSSYSPSTGQCTVSFEKSKCEHCRFRDKCHPKIYKRVAKLVISKKASDRAAYARTMHTERFRNLARIRNGIETVPSVLRKVYHVDRMPRGKQRGKFFFGSKIGAFNFRKLFSFRKGLGHYAENPLIA